MPHKGSYKGSKVPVALRGTKKGHVAAMKEKKAKGK